MESFLALTEDLRLFWSSKSRLWGFENLKFERSFKKIGSTYEAKIKKCLIYEVWINLCSAFSSLIVFSIWCIFRSRIYLVLVKLSIRPNTGWRKHTCTGLQLHWISLTFSQHLSVESCWRNTDVQLCVSTSSELLSSKISWNYCIIFCSFVFFVFLFSWESPSGAVISNGIDCTLLPNFWLDNKDIQTFNSTHCVGKNQLLCCLIPLS